MVAEYRWLTLVYLLNFAAAHEQFSNHNLVYPPTINFCPFSLFLDQCDGVLCFDFKSE